jgi:hypothetical protein
MIPAFMKDSVSHAVDGVMYEFYPKTGVLEKKLIGVFADPGNSEETEWKMRELIDEIVIAPKKDGLKASDLFNREEILVLFRYWNEANKVTDEEKKS